MNNTLKGFYRRVGRGRKLEGLERINEHLNTVRHYAPIVTALYELMAEIEKETLAIENERVKLLTLRSLARVFWRVDTAAASRIMTYIDNLEGDFK